MISAWQQLETRQRRLIVLAAAVALAALVYVQVWEPLAAAQAVHREQIAARQALLDWLEAIEPIADRLRDSGRDQRESSDRSLLGLADETARAAGLAGAMERIEPRSEEHTSELQSRGHLVCRLLLEKKKARKK